MSCLYSSCLVKYNSAARTIQDNPEGHNRRCDTRYHNLLEISTSKTMWIGTEIHQALTTFPRSSITS